LIEEEDFIKKINKSLKKIKIRIFVEKRVNNKIITIIF